jgi:NADPH:quinone reductase-like Zn-dependent oxidoreductase
MKAIVYFKYGPPDVLELQEIDIPVVNDDDVLVRVRASSVNPYDWHFMRGEPRFMRLISGLRKPKSTRLGVDLAGQVEAVGQNVTQFQPGDEVFGRGEESFGEYVCVSEQSLVHKPANITFEQAAGVYMAASTALQGLRDKGGIQPGHKVLINGASGGVGTFAVQIAKSFGAEVTGVCSTRNIDMVRTIGADHVVDYTQEDFTQGEQRYDLLFDTMGNYSLATCRSLLVSGGKYLMVGMHTGRWIQPLPRVIVAILLSRFMGKKMVLVETKLSNADLHTLKGLLGDAKIQPVIDRTYELSEIQEAIRYLEEGHAQGKVVITV